MTIYYAHSFLNIENLSNKLFFILSAILAAIFDAIVGVDVNSGVGFSGSSFEELFFFDFGLSKLDFLIWGLIYA